jgi:hypothetical protein
MSDSSEDSKSKTNTILIVLIVLLLLGGAFYIVSSKNSAPAEGTAPTAPPADNPTPEIVPSLTIKAVESGVSVTIEAKDFPADTDLTALMDKAGTDGSGGIQVGTGKTDANGYLSATYNIPPELAQESQLVIRLEGGAGYWAYHGFDNVQ